MHSMGYSELCIKLLQEFKIASLTEYWLANINCYTSHVASSLRKIKMKSARLLVGKESSARIRQYIRSSQKQPDPITVLQMVYGTYGFKKNPEIDDHIVRPITIIGTRVRCGIVSRKDFNASVDPIRYRARNLLSSAGYEDLYLIGVRISQEKRSIDFIFLAT